ncbi:MAG TPA: glycosyltransferase family 1 protein [Candidatus Hydrogenedentes bacterium]|nr:glycosyltransferase family 1 protein [Candidatus Hydrogenedentota bacterium]HPG69181.1 glycosyltransferase family 1 protein [Candidatus Hydrogenedentota bacterium]
MLVGVNTLTIKPGFGGGEEHYLRHVLSSIRVLQPEIRFVVFTDADNHDSFEGWERVGVGGGSIDLGRLPGLDSQLERAAKRAGVDILFTPLRTALPKSSVPQVLFATDLLFVEPDFMPRRRREGAFIREVKRTCQQAVGVIAPSKFVQRRFLELLDLSLDKVTVAPLGVDPVFGQPFDCIAEQPYVLSVGATHRFRNLPKLLEALQRLKDEIPHTLVVVGQAGDAEPHSWGARVVRVDRCPVAHLAGLYQHCDVFVSASLYEGSGVTVLEAMCSGAAVASSRVGGIPEVAGDIPVYFNPENVGAIAGAIRRLTEENETNHGRRVRFGRQLAAQYTWEQCAWKTISAFRRA